MRKRFTRLYTKIKYSKSRVRSVSPVVGVIFNLLSSVPKLHLHASLLKPAADRILYTLDCSQTIMIVSDELAHFYASVTDILCFGTVCCSEPRMRWQNYCTRALVILISIRTL